MVNVVFECPLRVMLGSQKARHEPEKARRTISILARYSNYLKGSFNNYVDRKGWMDGQPNVYAYKVNDCFLFTVTAPLKAALEYWLPP